MINPRIKRGEDDGGSITATQVSRQRYYRVGTVAPIL